MRRDPQYDMMQYFYPRKPSKKGLLAEALQHGKEMKIQGASEYDIALAILDIIRGN